MTWRSPFEFYLCISYFVKITINNFGYLNQAELDIKFLFLTLLHAIESSFCLSTNFHNQSKVDDILKN